ncbi:hypothetical protein QAD02_012481 [Eretmocerus hayati]|uniref:Uncharacterized protein n=1 Tax=Eretmocerus hayati TaxID=131215 RepID=A0ACC2P031_9HYME|nr:hypothetical protein QAD02_012481 [Eretmocerus hayati]
MDRSISLNNYKEIDLQHEGLITPCTVVLQRRIFAPPGSSSKRSLFQDDKDVKRVCEDVSDAESDLGPMSPLALTDHSSCDSSPGRQFVSPLATPEKSPVNPRCDWNHGNNSGGLQSPLNPLGKSTRSTRFSPRRVLSLSPKSNSTQSSSYTRTENTVTSPELTDETFMPDEVVPETPGKESDFDDQNSYVAETPQKDDHPEFRLLTPHGSVYKNIPIPRVHRRKSMSSLESKECLSPEIKKCSFKRHLEDSLSCSRAKQQKTDYSFLAPKARAALFQDVDKVDVKKPDSFTLNPRSFYGSNHHPHKPVNLDWRDPKPDYKKRRSLPSYTAPFKRPGKKNRRGEINCGVGHGIKKPKAKRPSPKTITTKTEKQPDSFDKTKNVKENVDPRTDISKNSFKNRLFIKNDQMSDSSKKFFKTKVNQSDSMTVDVRMNSSDMESENDSKHISKKPRIDALSDVNDLFDDEAADPKTSELSKVDNILKILEKDWDDEQDLAVGMFEKSSYQVRKSPRKPEMRLKNLTMSPASELSNMTSTMNIQDCSRPTGDSTSELMIENVSRKESSPRLYPLFAKNYSSDKFFDESTSRKRKRATSWQLSSKHSKSENQYQIDAGQKLFGATQCNECGIVYHIGDPDDENAHLNYHNSFKILKFQGWKNERVVYRDPYTSSRIILVEPKDSNLYWKKVTEVLEIVDRDLGLSDMKLSFYRDKKVYVYVRDKTILGVLVAEHVKNAFQMIPDLLELNCCTSETTPVKCGVNVVWTAMSHRRQGIATKLVDVLRANYYYGYIMSVNDIAFSTPTPSGKQFAEKYTKTRNFKVY